MHNWSDISQVTFSFIFYTANSYSPQEFDFPHASQQSQMVCWMLNRSKLHTTWTMFTYHCTSILSSNAGCFQVLLTAGTLSLNTFLVQGREPFFHALPLCSYVSRMLYKICETMGKLRFLKYCLTLIRLFFIQSCNALSLTV